MVAPVYTTDLVTINDATVVTGWSELTGMTVSAPPGVDTDLAIHGSACITCDRSKVGLTGFGYTGTAIGPLTAGHCIFIWSKFFAPNSMATLANGGARVMIGDSSTTYEGWYMDGSDTYAYGGWKNYVVDPTTAADQNDGTMGTGYEMVGVGWNLPTQAPSKGNPHNCDISRYGRGQALFTDGDVTNGYATFNGYALVNDNPTTGRFGLFQAIQGGYLWKGLMSLGSDATSVDMRDANVNITIDNTTKVTSTFNAIEVRHASSNVEWTAVNFTSLSTVSPGLFEAVANAPIAKTTCVFTDMSTFIYQSNSTITACTYRRCGQITQAGATFTGCVIEESPAAIAMVVTTIADVTGNSFVSDGTGHAVNLGTFAATGSVTWDNSESGYVTGVASVAGAPITTGTSGNETILCNVAAAQTLTINIAVGASTPSVKNDGTGDVKVIAGLKTISFTVNPSFTGYEWRMYTVTATGSLVGAVEVAGEESATVDNQSYAYSYTVDTPFAIQIISDTYVESVTYYTLVNADQDVTINLTVENND